MSPTRTTDVTRGFSLSLGSLRAQREPFVAGGEGRLTLEEYSERVCLAQAARTDQELARLARDLPGDRAAATPPAAVSDEHRGGFHFSGHRIGSPRSGTATEGGWAGNRCAAGHPRQGWSRRCGRARPRERRTAG